VCVVRPQAILYGIGPRDQLAPNDHYDYAKWKGKNVMGNILMKVRDRLIKNPPYFLPPHPTFSPVANRPKPKFPKFGKRLPDWYSEYYPK